MSDYDAIVVGSGPNGLVAAIELQKSGLKTLLIEEKEALGGGVKSAELTLPGYVHDVCSAVYPFGTCSAAFTAMPLESFGLRWLQPEIPLAHPFEDGTAAVIYRSVDETARSLGPDGVAYHQLFSWLVKAWDRLHPDLLAPLRFPSHPLLMARFGLPAIRSARALAHSRFHGREARGLFAGVAGHSFLPLDMAPSAAIGLVLTTAAHAVGWPIPQGGAGALSAAMVRYFESLGGGVKTGMPVRSEADLPSARIVLYDLSVPQLLRVVGEKLPKGYVRKLQRWKLGPGTFKIDYALSHAPPWTNATCRHAGTLHLGGSFEEIAQCERLVWEGKIPERPFLLFSQPTVLDSSRAPAGKHTAWAYCHVPRGSTTDMVEAIEAQIERYAPGFRDTVLARSVLSPLRFESHNANLLGGEISGGIADFRQLFFRPVMSLDPYALPLPGRYLSSSATPPGSGVHGLCGYFAARSALKRL